jgi:hypothetical protein
MKAFFNVRYTWDFGNQGINVVVWIRMILNSSCVEGLVTLAILRSGGIFGMGSSGRKLGHWDHALWKEYWDPGSSLSLSFASWSSLSETPLPYTPAMMYWVGPGPKSHSQVTMDWNLWNHVPNICSSWFISPGILLQWWKAITLILK